MYRDQRAAVGRGDRFGAVAQLVAHRTGSAGVTGSNPVSSTENARLPSHRAVSWLSPALLFRLGFVELVSKLL